MSETNPFFLWIFRIAGILVLGMLLLFAYLLISNWWESRQRQGKHDNEVVKVEQKASDGRTRRLSLQFGDIKAIAGTDRLMLPVESKSEDESTGFSSGGYRQDKMRNLVFLDAGYEHATWLYANNEGVIVDYDVLQACSGRSDAAKAFAPSKDVAAAEAVDDPCGSDDRGPARAIFLSVRLTDSNRDGDIDEKDAASFALVRPDGSGYRELTEPTGRVLEEKIHGDTIGLLVQTDSRLSYRRYAIADFKMMSETPVADLRR